MLRVYLDQAKWVDLSKYRAGRLDGARFRDVDAVASEAVRSGHVSFVLSFAHYYETHRRRDTQSRLALADTMASLSRFHTIAHPKVVVPAEIEQYLTGRPVTSQVDLFGVGIEHAFDADFGLRASSTAFDVLDPRLRAIAKERAAQGIEQAFLSAAPMPDDRHEVILATARKIKEDSQKFADLQTEIAQHISDNKLRDQLADITVASEIADIFDPLWECCRRHGIDLNELLPNGESRRNLLQNTPSRWVTSELRRVRLRNPQQQWQKNDHNDLEALSIAVPYCDVVVAERQWASHINRLGLAEKYGTTVLHDLTELTDVLVTASLQTS